jgi:uncharacterized protein YndB with AHSA1/START domain
MKGDVMQIDHNAPMTAKDSVLISADMNLVWQVLTDFDHWPEWQSAVSAASLEADLSVGAEFRWKAQGLNIQSEIRDLNPGQRIGWVGDSLGMQAIHIWDLEPHENGTLVNSQESLSGWLARLMKLFDRDFLQKSMVKSLQELQERVMQLNQEDTP